MLQQIDLRWFKCFDHLRLPLAPLTVLSGANASGKSTVMQALVVLHQTILVDERSVRLMLNGEEVRLGTASEVVEEVHGGHTLGIALEDEGFRYEWVFGGGRDEMSMAVDRIRTGDQEILKPEELFRLMPVAGAGAEALAAPGWSLGRRLRRLSYLGADRTGPREYSVLEDRSRARGVGARGEYAASILHSSAGDPVLEGLVVQGAAPTLLGQVGARMGWFFPGCGVTVERLEGFHAVVLQFRTSARGGFHRPVHAGFGLSQVFPIIVAALMSEEDDLLLVENPEAHLHPAGQARMGEFLASVASAGAQVILETHSDHVLNGVRRAVRNGTLAANGVALHFFRPRGEAGDTEVAQVQSPTLADDGTIDEWPEGFFDQFDKDMTEIAGWS